MVIHAAQKMEEKKEGNQLEKEQVKERQAKSCGVTELGGVIEKRKIKVPGETKKRQED